MPSIVIHEEVAVYLSSIIHCDSYEYYLGVLAPDAPNINGFAEKEERWMAHVRRKNLQEWRNSLYNFYLLEKNNYPKDFLIGYIIHILTDIIYDDFLYLKVREEIEKKGISREESHNIMREDMKKYHFEKEDYWKDILKTSNTSFSIQNISKEELLEWKEKQLLEETSKSQFITKEVIEELNRLVRQELLERYQI